MIYYLQPCWPKNGRTVIKWSAYKGFGRLKDASHCCFLLFYSTYLLNHYAVRFYNHYKVLIQHTRKAAIFDTVFSYVFYEFYLKKQYTKLLIARYELK